MNLISRALSAFQKKDVGLSDKKEDRIWYDFGAVDSRDWSQVSAALRAGFVLANGMGMMPIDIVGPNGERDTSSQAYNLLNVRPNDFMTAVEFKETLTLHAVFTGTGRAFIRRSGTRKRPIELVPLHPNWTPGGWQLVNGEYVLPIDIPGEGYLGEFTRNDVLEISNPRWNLVGGLNVTSTCKSVLGLTSQLQDRQARLSDKNSPFGVITTPNGTSDAAISKLKSSWKKQFGQSGIAVIDFDAKFSQLMQTPQDQQMQESLRFQIEEVARMYGVHPYFLMQTAGSGAQGAVADAMLFHQVYSIGPWVNRLEASIEYSLLARGERAEMDQSCLMRSTPSIRAEIYAKALGAGGNKPWMTENEVRSGKSPFNLPERPEGNGLTHQKEVSNDA